jgi:hypothetical protein
MRSAILILALGLSLSACTTLSGKGNNDLALKVLGNLEHCKRTYTATVGMGANGSLNIECPPRPFDAQP